MISLARSESQTSSLDTGGTNIQTTGTERVEKGGFPKKTCG